MTVADTIPGKTRIQQLLAAIGTNAHGDDSKVESVDYDWHQPHFFNSQQTKKLAGFAARIATLIAAKFSALCQHNFEVSISSTSEHFASQCMGRGAEDQEKEQVAYLVEKLIDTPEVQNKEQDNYYLPFKPGQVEGEESCGFISIPPQTAAVWATQLLGDAESKDNSNKPLSSLEASFLFDMASLVIESISGAGEKCAFRPAADSIVGHLPLQLKGTEEFYRISFQVKKTGSNTPSEAHILIFCEKLLPAIGEVAQASKFTLKDVARAMQSHIEKIPVPITVQLACVQVTVDEILNLSAGDVLLLDKKTNEPVQLIAAGRTVCRGLCAKSGNNYALAVTEAVPTNSTQPNVEIT